MAPVEFDPADWKTWPEWKLEEVYGKLHDLAEFTNPKNYKSYDDLKSKLMRVFSPL